MQAALGHAKGGSVDSSGEKFIIASGAEHGGYFSDGWQDWRYSTLGAQCSEVGDSVSGLWLLWAL